MKDNDGGETRYLVMARRDARVLSKQHIREKLRRFFFRSFTPSNHDDVDDDEDDDDVAAPGVPAPSGQLPRLVYSLYIIREASANATAVALLQKGKE